MPWLIRCVAFCAALALPVYAQADTKLRVEDTRLIYDTENVTEEETDSIASQDVDPFLNMLQQHPSIQRLELNSTGGSLWAAARIADIVIDYELDTHVNGQCSSTCTRVFLAGANRTMARGSRIGFHQSWWSPQSVQSYYEREAEDKGWDTPFDMASWVYSDTQSEIHELLTYVTDRGVDPLFAINILQVPADEMWHPRRRELLDAGVLTE